MVVGNGPAQAEAEELLPEAHFTGFIKGDELARAYASSDIFFFPSHTETFGNVTLEAMASGLPCLVADAIGSKSLVKHGVNGFWAEKESVTDFTEKLKIIVEDDDRRLEMGAKSREFSLGYSGMILMLGYLTITRKHFLTSRNENFIYIHLHPPKNAPLKVLVVCNV